MLSRFRSDAHNNFINYNNQEYDAAYKEALAAEAVMEQKRDDHCCQLFPNVSHILVSFYLSMNYKSPITTVFALHYCCVQAADYRSDGSHFFYDHGDDLAANRHIHGEAQRQAD